MPETNVNVRVMRPGLNVVLIDDIRCRTPINADGSSTHIRIDWPDGHEILVARESAEILRDWLVEVLEPETGEPNG